jgi:thiol-disulfide isomerase/thioredoxin
MKLHKFCLVLLALVVVIIQVQAKPVPHSIRISGTIANCAHIDTVRLIVWEHYYTDAKPMTCSPKIASTIAINGKFSVTVNGIIGPVYLCLEHSSWPNHEIPFRPLLPDFQLAEPGDDIIININTNDPEGVFDPSKSELKFAGTGAAKYECYYFMKKKDSELIKLDLQQKNAPRASASNADTLLVYILFNINKLNKRLNSMNLILNSFKNKIVNHAIFNQMSADLTGRFLSTEIAHLTSLALNHTVRSDSVSLQVSRSFYSLLSPILAAEKYNPKVIAQSHGYITFLILKESLLHYLSDPNDNHHDPLPDLYSVIKSKYTGEIRDRMLLRYFLAITGNIFSDTIRAQLKDALSYISDENVKAVIIDRMLSNRFTVGDKAVAFTLENEHGEKITMADFKGKIVLLDFWYTGCVWCADYYEKVLSKIEEKYKEDPRFKVVSINVDKNKEQWLNSLKLGRTYQFIPSGFSSATVKYSSALATNLFIGTDQSLVDRYNIEGYPHPLLFDDKGVLVSADQSMTGLRNFDFLDQFIQKLKRNIKE